MYTAYKHVTSEFSIRVYSILSKLENTFSLRE